jgi:hypothetical protein
MMASTKPVVIIHENDVRPMDILLGRAKSRAGALQHLGSIAFKAFIETKLPLYTNRVIGSWNNINNKVYLNVDTVDSVLDGGVVSLSKI